MYCAITFLILTVILDDIFGPFLLDPPILFEITFDREVFQVLLGLLLPQPYSEEKRALK